MFGMKKQLPILSLVGEGTTIRGELRFTKGLRVDGEIIGDVVAGDEAASILVISEKARIVGKVRAGHVIINGSVIGPVISDELLELQPKARIQGDVKYEALEMHQGATIDGQLQPLSASEQAGGLKLAAATSSASAAAAPNSTLGSVNPMSTINKAAAK